jgi:hypothetical protein
VSIPTYTLILLTPTSLQDGRTALIEASLEDNQAVMAALIAAGADVDVADKVTSFDSAGGRSCRSHLLTCRTGTWHASLCPGGGKKGRSCRSCRYCGWKICYRGLLVYLLYKPVSYPRGHSSFLRSMQPAVVASVCTVPRAVFLLL